MTPLATLITVLTFNVYQGFSSPAERCAAMGAELERLVPDVVTFQEVPVSRGKAAGGGGDMSSGIDGLLPHHTHRVVKGTPGGYQQAIVSRWPIVRVVELPFPNNRQRMALGAVIAVPGAAKPVLVLTTHLDYQLDHSRQRAAQLGVMLEAAKTHDGPVVLTGDFNFGDGEPEAALLEAAPWRDAFRTLHPDAPGYTWDREKNSMARAGSLKGEGSRRLDKIVVRGATPKTARVVLDAPIRPGLFPSDHFGVFAVLAL